MKKIILAFVLLSAPAYAGTPNQGNPTFNSVILQTPLAASSGGCGSTSYAGCLVNLGGAPLASPTFTGTVTAPNLSVSGTVSGAGFSSYLASPPAIGGTAAAAGAFTNLSSSGTVSGAGFTSLLSGYATAGANSNITSLSGLAGTYNTTSGTQQINATNYLYGSPSGTLSYDCFCGTENVTGNLQRFEIQDTASAGWTGYRNPLLITMSTAAPGDAIGHTTIPLQATVQTGAGEGGTYLNPLGGVFGGDFNSFMTGSPQWMAANFGLELDVNTGSGMTTVARKNDLNIVLTYPDTQRGFQEDAAISFNSQPNVADSWLYGIEFGSPTQLWSFGTDSTLIGAVVRQTPFAPNLTSNTALYGTNWQNVNFTAGGAAFSSSGFEVDPTGNIYGAGLNLTGSIQILNTSVASVTVNAGGVYTTFPSIVIAAPPNGGTQATATVATMAAAANAPQVSFGNAGTGCTSGGTVTPSGDTGTEPTYTVTATGGVATGLILLTPGSITAMGSQPHSFTGASCSGLTATIAFQISTITVTNAGSNYPVKPTPLVISTTPSSYSHDVSLSAVMSANLSGTLALNPLGGAVQFGTGAFTGNGTNSLSLTNIAPSGAHATVQEWLTITDATGNVRYIPAF